MAEEPSWVMVHHHSASFTSLPDYDDDVVTAKPINEVEAVSSFDQTAF